MKFLMLLPLLVLFLFELDISRNHYDTHDDLMADDRGWLPNILPGSANDIRVTNNLDLNTSRGEFEHSDTDAGAFFARLSLGAPEARGGWSETVREYRQSGYIAWTYREGAQVWTFFCHPVKDRCEYYMK